MKKNFCLLIFCVFLLGCQSETSPSLSSTPVKQTTFATIPPTRTTRPPETQVQPPNLPEPTNTIIPSQEPIPTQYTTPTPTAIPYTNCQQVVDEYLPTGFLAEGSIIFMGECKGKTGFYKLSSETMRIEPFLEGIAQIENRGRFLTAPNQEWFLFDNFSRGADGGEVNSLIFSSADDNNAVAYPFNPRWSSYLSGWSDNYHLLTLLWRNPEVTFAIINPFAGEWYQVDDEYEFWCCLYQSKFFSYSADFSRILQAPDDNTIVLEDRATADILWTGSRSSYFHDPAWSPDGSVFVYPEFSDEADHPSVRLIIVDRNGLETPVEGLFNTNGLIHPVWSPNSQFISFWEFIALDRFQLIIINRTTLTQIDFSEIRNTRNSETIFSPSHEQFAIAIEQDANATLVVDLNTNAVIEIPWSLWPVSWLKNSSSQVIPKIRLELPSSPSEEAPLVQQKCLARRNIDQFTDWPSNEHLIFSKDFVLKSMSADLNIKTFPNGTLNWHGQALISPNRNWVAYISERPRYDEPLIIHVTTLNGDQVHEIENDKLGLLAWLDNETLEIARQEYGSYYLDLVFPFENRFQTNTSFVDRIYRERYPNSGGYEVCGDYCVGDHWTRGEMYSADFERVIYLHHVPLGYENPTPGLSLLDLTTGELLWSYHNWDVAFAEPTWSPDQKQFAVGLPTDSAGEHYEIFIVDREGRQTQATNLREAYPAVTLEYPVWSPDGRFIAFWGDTREKLSQIQRNPFRLFILDTETRLVTDTCIYGDYTDNEQVHWSLDGTIIALNSSHETGDNQIILINFEEEYATHLIDGWLAGWMIEP